MLPANPMFDPRYRLIEASSTLSQRVNTRRSENAVIIDSPPDKLAA
jgi:hypothetical protein